VAAIGFPEAWEAYRTFLVLRGRSPRTIATYRRALYAFVAFLKRQRRPKHWTRARPADLERFLDRPSARGGPLAPKSRETYATAVAGFYGWAARQRLIRRDPMAEVIAPALSRHAIPRSIPWKDTPAGPGMATLLSYAETDPRLRIMILLCYRAGLRISEVAGLRAEDVSLGERPTMRVLGKGDRERIVPLHPWLRDELAAWLATRPSRGPVVSHALHPGRHISGHYVGDLIGTAMRSLGIVNDAGTPATPHGLRHTFGTEMAAVGHGRNERAIGIALGHAPGSAITRLYTLGYDEDVAEDVAELPDHRTPAAARQRAPAGRSHPG
jgi:site-specific recombinase XerC